MIRVALGFIQPTVACPPHPLYEKRAFASVGVLGVVGKGGEPGLGKGLAERLVAEGVPLSVHLGQEYLPKLVLVIVGEFYDVVPEPARKAAVHGEQLLHLPGIASEDDPYLTLKVLVRHELVQLVHDLTACLVCLVDEQHVPDVVVEHLLNALRPLAVKGADLYFLQFPRVEDSDQAEYFPHDTPDRGLAGARSADEHETQIDLVVIIFAFLPLREDVHAPDIDCVLLHLLLYGSQAYQTIKRREYHLVGFLSSIHLLQIFLGDMPGLDRALAAIHEIIAKDAIHNLFYFPGIAPGLARAAAVKELDDGHEFVIKLLGAALLGFLGLRNGEEGLRRIIVEIDSSFRWKPRRDAGIGLFHLLHLVRIACHDDGDVGIVLHGKHQDLERFLTIYVRPFPALLEQGIGFIDEEDTTVGLFDNGLGLDAGLPYVLTFKVCCGCLNEMPLRKKARVTHQLAGSPGHDGLSGTGGAEKLPGESQMDGETAVLQALQQFDAPENPFGLPLKSRQRTHPLAGSVRLDAVHERLEVAGQESPDRHVLLGSELALAVRTGHLEVAGADGPDKRIERLPGAECVISIRNDALGDKQVPDLVLLRSADAEHVTAEVLLLLLGHGRPGTVVT